GRGTWWSPRSRRTTMAARGIQRFMQLAAFTRFAALSLVAAPLGPALVTAAPLENVSDIGPALLRCWHPPAAPDGSAVTLRFSFRRDGSLMGAPRVTYVGVDGGAKAEREFADSAVRAIEQCAPLELSPK